MRYKIISNSYSKLAFLLALGLVSFTQSQASQAKNNIENYSYIASLDSIKTVIDNGFRFVIHEVKVKDTYYKLSKQYGVTVQELMDANYNKTLRIGDTVKIPRGKVNVASEVQKTKTDLPKSNTVLINLNDFTEYKVGKSETLYAISRRFNISVDDIKRFNRLTSNNIKEGQIIKIPKSNLSEETHENTTAPLPKPETLVLPEILTENQSSNESIIKPNRYGIREKSEKGIGMWQENLSVESQASLALHKTAPIGTILKITNPMNQSVTFAKVVGKFVDNEDTQGAIVVLSKSVASSIGLLDKKFQVEITYGLPLD